jgi:DnaJ-class molecular chaperone
MTNPYQTLNINKTATDAEVERAFKQAAKRTHPDKPGGSKEKFNEAVRSKQLLLDPARRKHYDQTGNFTDPEPDNSANFPISLIMNIITNAAARFANNVGGDPTQTNLLDHVRKQLTDTLNKGKLQRATHQKVADTLKQIEQRLKQKVRRKKSVSPMLKLAIVAQAAAVERDVAKLDPQIEAHERALKLLDDWTFEVATTEQHSNALWTRITYR